MGGWHNVSKREPCPICGKPDWCNLSDDGMVAICHRVESPRLARSGSGWIHRLREAVNPVFRRANNRQRTATIDFARIHAAYCVNSTHELAETLGVTDSSLVALDVRLNRMDDCWSFPMRDADGHITGLRYRERRGSRKWSARGSHDGLFSPQNPLAGPLFISEGASDTAALLSLGVNAVGRSSCQTGAALLPRYIRRLRARSAIIVADNDTPGIQGADLLAHQLRSIVPTRVLVVPAPHKDLRDWYRSGSLTPKLLLSLASAQTYA